MLSKSIKRRLRDVLHCGLTPDKLALTLCLGVTIGVLPVPWGATVLCVVCGYIFRLNQVALQTVNYLAYPLQIALLIPFSLLGNKLFPWGPQTPPELLSTLLHGHLSGSIHLLAWTIVKAMAAWLVTAVPVAVVLYLPLFAFVKQMAGNSGVLEVMQMDEK
jgi:hypothetical protein